MRLRILATTLIVAMFCLANNPAIAAGKPNILVIMSDDVGVHNVSAYSRGLVGCQTPSLDRIVNEGMMFLPITMRNRVARPAGRLLSPDKVRSAPA